MSTVLYENYGIPSFLIGSQRRQPSPFKMQTPHSGNPYIDTVTSDLLDLPVSWDVKLTMTDAQAGQFNIFLNDVYTAGAGYFKKNMVTEGGINQHTLTIIGARPQGTRVQNGVWSYSFTIYSSALDLSITPIPPPAEIPAYPIAAFEPSTFVYMAPDYLNTGASGNEEVIVMQSARDVGKAIVLARDGHASLTNDKGQTWQRLAQGLNSGSIQQGRTLAVSDNGQIIWAGFFGGYVSKSIDGGTNFLPQPRGLGNPGGNFWACQQIVMSGDGNIVMAFFENGTGMRSLDGGSTFSYMRDFGGTLGLFYVADMSKDGQTAALGIELDGVGPRTGYVYITRDAGANWETRADKLGLMLQGTFGVLSISVSDDGETGLVTFDTDWVVKTRDNFTTFTEVDEASGITGGSKRFAASTMNGNGKHMFLGSKINGKYYISIDFGESWTEGDDELSDSSISSKYAIANKQFFMVSKGAKSYISSADFIVIPTYPVGISPTTWSRVLPDKVNSGAGGISVVNGCMSSDGLHATWLTSLGYGSKTVDGGTSWTPLQRGFGTSNISARPQSSDCSDDGSVMFIGCDDGYISRSLTSGDTFEEITRGASMTSTGDIWALCTDATGETVFVSNLFGESAMSYNAGNTFTRLSDTIMGSKQAYYASAMSKDGLLIMIGGRLGYSALSTDGGATWTPKTLGLAGSNSSIRTISMSESGAVIFAGKADGEGVISTDSGATWALISPKWLNSGATSGEIRRSAMSFDGNIIVATIVTGYMCYSDDAGSTWNALPRNLDVNAGGSAPFDSILTNGQNWLAYQTALGKVHKSVG